MKRCFKCYQEKGLNDFYKHSGMVDGHVNKCIACSRIESLKNRDKNLEKIRAYDRWRNMNPERVEARKRYIKSPAGKEVKKTISRNYRVRHPEKVDAVRKLNNAVRDGKIIPRFCEMCPTSTKAHAHHDDYSKPFDVIWLCPKHHKERHRYLDVINNF